MKISHLAYGVAGFVVGARAGRERYDQVVRIARRVAGSQTVQSTAGVAQAQLDQAIGRAKSAAAAKLTGRPAKPGDRAHSATNGYRHV